MNKSMKGSIDTRTSHHDRGSGAAGHQPPEPDPEPGRPRDQESTRGGAPPGGWSSEKYGRLKGCRWLRQICCEICCDTCLRLQRSGGFHSHGGTSHHPFMDFPVHKNQPAIGDPQYMTSWNPHLWWFGVWIHPAQMIPDTWMIRTEKWSCDSEALRIGLLPTKCFPRVSQVGLEL